MKGPWLVELLPSLGGGLMSQELQIFNDAPDLLRVVFGSTLEGFDFSLHLSQPVGLFGVVWLRSEFQDLSLKQLLLFIKR